MEISDFSKKSTDILFSKYPFAAGSGVLVGILVFEIVQYLDRTFLVTIPSGISQLPEIIYVLFSLLIFISVAHARRPKLSSSIREALEFIKIAKRDGKINDSKAQLMYAQLYKRILDRVELTGNIKKEVEKADKTSLSD